MCFWCCGCTAGSSIDVKLRCSGIEGEHPPLAHQQCWFNIATGAPKILICDYCLHATRHSDRHSLMHRPLSRKGVSLSSSLLPLLGKLCKSVDANATADKKNSLGPEMLSMSFCQRNCSRLKIQVACSDFDPGQLRCYIERDTQISMSWERRTLVLLLQGRTVKPFTVFVKAFFMHFCLNVSFEVPVECKLAHSSVWTTWKLP